MKRLIALVTGSLLGCASLLGPAVAATDDTTPTYTQHQADCLALLFTDPKAHAEQCGGPFTPAPPPHGSSGSGTPTCQTGDISPLIVPWSRPVLVAGPEPCNPNPCFVGLLTPGSASMQILDWSDKTSAVRLLAAC